MHHDPVRIPLSALPPPPRPQLRGSTFATTLVIGVTAAPWFAAALFTGERVANTFALVWSVVLLMNLLVVLRHR